MPDKRSSEIEDGHWEGESDQQKERADAAGRVSEEVAAEPYKHGRERWMVGEDHRWSLATLPIECLVSEEVEVAG